MLSHRLCYIRPEIGLPIVEAPVVAKLMSPTTAGRVSQNAPLVDVASDFGGALTTRPKASAEHRAVGLCLVVAQRPMVRGEEAP